VGKRKFVLIIVTSVLALFLLIFIILKARSVRKIEVVDNLPGHNFELVDSESLEVVLSNMNILNNDTNKLLFIIDDQASDPFYLEKDPNGNKVIEVSVDEYQDILTITVGVGEILLELEPDDLAERIDSNIWRAIELQVKRMSPETEMSINTQKLLKPKISL